MIQRIANSIMQTVQSGQHGGIPDMFLKLGHDSPLRAKLAYDILSKALNYSKLVRVQRVVSKNGKSYVTHVWVKPDKVKKGDVVIAGKKALDDWRSDQQNAHVQDEPQQKAISGWNGKVNDMDAETMNALHTEALESSSLSKRYASVSWDSIRGTCNYVYKQYGYDAAVAYVTAYANDLFEYDEWTVDFEDTETRYAPTLLAMARYEWTDGNFQAIRYADKDRLGESLPQHGERVYFKICSDVLNDMIDADGGETPEILYRGLSSDKDDLSELVEAEIGGTITLGSLSSFSASEDIAADFLKEEESWNGVILKLETGNSVNSLYVRGMEDRDEQEYVISDGPFQITGRETEEGEWGATVTLTVRPLPKDDEASQHAKERE